MGSGFEDLIFFIDQVLFYASLDNCIAKIIQVIQA